MWAGLVGEGAMRRELKGKGVEVLKVKEQVAGIWAENENRWWAYRRIRGVDWKGTCTEGEGARNRVFGRRLRKVRAGRGRKK